MPVKVNYLENGKGVEILATGIVYGNEIIKANEEIIASQNLESIQYHLIDKSGCTEYDVTASDIEKISEFDQLFTEANPKIIMAIVESKTLQFSLTVLWQFTVDIHDIKNNSFADRKAALEWINEHIQQ